MKYTLLTSCLKGLSQDTYFFITGFHILILHKNLPKTKHLFCLLGFGSTNFIFWVLINESEIRGVTHTLICLQSEVICSKILEAWYPHDNCQYQSEVSGVYGIHCVFNFQQSWRPRSSNQVVDFLTRRA